MGTLGTVGTLSKKIIYYSSSIILTRFGGFIVVNEDIIDNILSVNDVDKGGDNALDGFEFQMSSAIYLMFNEIKLENDFILIYEKIEDFILFTEEVALYQAKSINRNLTPNVLYSPSRKTKRDNTGLSIIEKMQDNYEQVKAIVSEGAVTNNLIICENQSFSTKLSKSHSNIKELTNFNFNFLENEAKEEIVKKTKHNNYNWCDINAIRLLPKSRHSEVTRIFIEDVILDHIGENKINSRALYNAIQNEIKRIRKFKDKLTYSFIDEQIRNYSIFEDDLKFSDYNDFLNDEDRINFRIKSSFNSIQNYIKMTNHPFFNDYEKISNKLTDSRFSNIYDLYNLIENDDEFDDLRIRLNEDEIKALILIVVAKEIN